MSIFDNIGLGRPGVELDESKVEEAAIKGGASGFVERLKGKYATVLQPVETKECLNIDKNHPLRKIYDEWETRTDVSGEQSGLSLIFLNTILTDDQAEKDNDWSRG